MRPAAISPSRALLANPIVQLFWQCDSSGPESSGPVQVLGWGRKRSGLQAQVIARKQNLEYRLLEDGFVRSLGREDPALSVVVDDEGIYYDALQPSRLERLIATPLKEAERQRAQQIVGLWQQLNVSKYNAAPEYSRPLPESYVLVVDQVAGDASIAFGQADARSFQLMLEAALAENPHSTVILKVHPDAFTRAKAGHFDLATLQHPRLQIIAENCHPGRLLESAQRVYTVTSQMGFEALIWGKPVRCFGMPFYAGWGVTEDQLAAPERRRMLVRNLPAGACRDQLVHAALVSYSRYMDPETHKPTELETVMQLLALQRQQWLWNHALGDVYALGFSAWKRPILKDFLFGAKLHCCNKASQVPEGATLLIWGVKPLPQSLQRQIKKVIRIEDGFLRSSGLGADLIRPLSWVLDDVGMYYDASKPSRLERILAEQEFTDTQLAAAAELRTTIVAERISKYNLIGGEWRPGCVLADPAATQRVVLVPGQVETDASIRTGATTITTNLVLLQQARLLEPTSWLVFKPHPDVVAGLRSQDVALDEYRQYCDEIVLAGDSSQMLEQVDAVHTMTSLLGFEALLRGKQVFCHGMPFYAGWGLTTDAYANERRGRQRSLDELVAAALVVYPTYVSAQSHRFSSAQRIVAELKTWKRNGPSVMPFWRRCLRVVLRLWVATGIRKNA